MTNSDKVIENRIRRKLARRHGWTLHKNPRRDPLASDYGSYVIRDEHGAIVDTYVDLFALAVWENQ